MALVVCLAFGDILGETIPKKSAKYDKKYNFLQAGFSKEQIASCFFSLASFLDPERVLKFPIGKE